MRERQHRMTREKIENREAFYRALATADTKKDVYLNPEVEAAFSAFAEFQKGDKVKHVMDLDGYTYTVVGVRLRPSTVLIGCKVKGRKALWFPTNLLREAE